MENIRPIKRALLSVSDKAGIVEFARELSEKGVEILSTGGTCKLLAENGIKVTEVSDYTGFPEMMDGRVKTLHPKIHGGILARRGIDEAIMSKNNIDAIDMVVVNLYPFSQTIAKQGVTVEDARGNIDIGGPTMIRASAKNFIRVASVVDPGSYSEILEKIKVNNGSLSLEDRFALSQKAFAHTALYDKNIADYLGARSVNEVQSCYKSGE